MDSPRVIYSPIVQQPSSSSVVPKTEKPAEQQPRVSPPPLSIPPFSVSDTVSPSVFSGAKATVKAVAIDYTKPFSEIMATALSLNPDERKQVILEAVKRKPDIKEKSMLLGLVTHPITVVTFLIVTFPIGLLSAGVGFGLFFLFHKSVSTKVNELIKRTKKLYKKLEPRLAQQSFTQSEITQINNDLKILKQNVDLLGLMLTIKDHYGMLKKDLVCLILGKDPSESELDELNQQMPAKINPFLLINSDPEDVTDNLEDHILNISHECSSLTTLSRDAIFMLKNSLAREFLEADLRDEASTFDVDTQKFTALYQDLLAKIN